MKDEKVVEVLEYYPYTQGAIWYSDGTQVCDYCERDEKKRKVWDEWWERLSEIVGVCPDNKVGFLIKGEITKKGKHKQSNKVTGIMFWDGSASIGPKVDERFEQGYHYIPDEMFGWEKKVKVEHMQCEQ